MKLKRKNQKRRQLKKALSIKKKEIKKKAILEEISDDSEDVEIIKKNC